LKLQIAPKMLSATIIWRRPKEHEIWRTFDCRKTDCGILDCHVVSSVYVAWCRQRRSFLLQHLINALGRWINDADDS